MTDVELAWVAGILEGEASFGFSGSLLKRRQMRAQCGMTDADVIDRLHKLCGGNVTVRKFKAYKDLYVWTLTKRSELIPFLRQLQPLMGVRRSARIQELLNYYESHPDRTVGLVHGTRHAYTHYGCRCDDCKKASSDYLKHNRTPASKV